MSRLRNWVDGRWPTSCAVPLLTSSRTWWVETYCACETMVVIDTNAVVASRKKPVLRVMDSPWGMSWEGPLRLQGDCQPVVCVGYHRQAPNANAFERCLQAQPRYFRYGMIVP